MSFAAQVRAWAEQAERRSQQVFLDVATETLRSVQEGHPATGAPGQPVGQGYPGHVGGTLRNSWTLLFRGPHTALISTNVIYAPGIEEGISQRTGRALTLRSSVGGFHSVALTKANFRALVEYVVRLHGARR